MPNAAQAKNFIKTIGPIIQREAFARGYMVPSAIIGQACLESRYGYSGLAEYHNYFGLKCGASWRGSSVNMQTKEEYIPGTKTNIKANFRTFPNIVEGVKGYFDFISTKRYTNLKTAKTPAEYLTLIKADGYATSYTYVKDVLNVVQKWDLVTYDIEPGAQKIQEDKTNKYEGIATRVIKGEFGNGEERKARLISLGYDPDIVQQIVNILLKNKK